MRGDEATLEAQRPVFLIELQRAPNCCGSNGRTGRKCTTIYFLAAYSITLGVHILLTQVGRMRAAAACELGEASGGRNAERYSLQNCVCDVVGEIVALRWRGHRYLRLDCAGMWASTASREVQRQGARPRHRYGAPASPQLHLVFFSLATIPVFGREVFQPPCRAAHCTLLHSHSLFSTGRYVSHNQLS